jgi:cytidylate kinase
MIKGALEKAKLYLESRSKVAETVKPGPCITISRETGAGADVVSEILAEYLQQFNNSPVKWAIFYKNLIEIVINDHNLPAAIKNLMQEKKYSHINTFVNELLAGSPGHYALEHKTAETILRLAGLGNVIIVGRGASIITSKLPNCFHVRLVAPVEKRIQHVQEVYGISSRTEAADFLKREDEARTKYIKTQFHKDISDSQLYHMVLNTGEFSYKLTAEIIGDTILKLFK